MDRAFSPSAEFNRLIAAAAADSRFCRQLLADPYAALARGYLGHTFSLLPHERAWLLSSRATSLSALADHLMQCGTQPPVTLDLTADPAALADELVSRVAQVQDELSQVRQLVGVGAAAERLGQLDRTLQRVVTTSHHLLGHLHAGAAPRQALAG